MFRQFFKDSAIYGLAGVLTRAMSLLLLPLYTRVLMPTDYGVVDFIAVLTSLVNLTVALEISQGLARALGDTEEPAERHCYASTALWFTIVAYSLFAIVALILAEPLSTLLLDSPAHTLAIRIGTISAWFGGLVYLVQNQLRWDLRARETAILGGTIALFTLGSSVVLVIELHLGVAGVLLAQALGLAIGLLIGLRFAWGSFRLVFDWAKCREMLHFSIPLVPSGIGVFVTLYIDRIAIKELLTIADLGIFGTGYRIASVVSLLMVGFQGALTPLVYANHRDSNAPRDLARIFRYFVAGALMLIAGLSLFARELLFVFASAAYAQAALVVPFLALALLLSNMYIFAPGLGLARRTGVVAVINVGGALINTGLNLLLIPRLGIVGAALATMISAGCIFGAYMIFSQWLYYVPHQWTRLSAAVATTVAIVTVGTCVVANLWISIPIKLALVALLAVIFVALRLIEREKLQEVLVRAMRLRTFSWM